MADQKVSDLPALNGADVDAADLLYIVDSSAGSAGSKKITVGQYQLAPVSGGTANGVLYLNASKVATAGSDLVFDGTNLGVGTSSPGEKLAVNQGNIYALRTGGAKLRLADQNNEVSVESSPTGVVSNMVFKTAAATQMTLDSSGNLGLGVTPSAWQTGGTVKAIDLGTYAAVSQSSTRTSVWNNAYRGAAGVAFYKNNGLAALYDQDGGVHAWYNAPNNTSGAGAAAAFTQAMALDASGNLVVGNTSAYARMTSYVASSGTFQNAFGASNGVDSDLQIRIKTGVSDFQNSAGVITFTTGTTERARITSGGNLLVGLSAATFVSTRLEVEAATNNNALGAKTTQNNYAPLMAWNSATSGDNLFQYFYTEGALTLRGSIDYNRAGGLVRYNTTSDYRAKDIIGPVQNPGATIDALKVYEGKMKGATQSRPMLIAHEAQAHAPYAVSGVKDEVNEDGTPKFQQMDVSSLVPLLLVEIQSLRARVAALESA